MRRRLWIALVVGLTCATIALALLPLWLGLALRPLTRSYGIEYQRYERLGYARFALHGVVVARPGWHASASRIEATTPLVFLWRHWRDSEQPVRIADWKVETRPSDREKSLDATSSPSGWMSLQTQLRHGLAQVAPWLPRVEADRGVVRWPEGEATVLRVVWAERGAATAEFVYHGKQLRATAAFPENDRITLTIEDLDEPHTLAAEIRGAEVTGHVTAWGQRAPFRATFAPSGWLPTTAALNAQGWRIPGSAVGLAEYYSTVGADARFAWKDGRFETAISARGIPVAANERLAPPLTLELEARGDRENVALEKFIAHAPGIAAQLGQPISISRQGEIRGDGARFSVQADLAKFPQLAASGSVSGEAIVRGSANRESRVVFEFRAHDVHASGVAVTTATAQGDFTWPQVQVTAGTLVGSAGDRLDWRGGWNFPQREIVAAHVSGDVRRETIARWLPAQPTFDSVRIEASLEGAVKEPRHSGHAEVAALAFEGAKPSALSLDWRGRGFSLDEISARLAAGDTTLHWAGSSTSETVRINSLRLTRGETLLLRATRPATLRWKPTPQVTDLHLAHADRLVHADVVWGETGSVAAAVRNFPSTWLEDFVELPGPSWDIESLALIGGWDRGPAVFDVTLGVKAEVATKRSASLHLAASGDSNGIRLDALRGETEGATALTATGHIPVIVSPAGASLVKFEPEFPLALVARASPESAFWYQFAALTGVALDTPRLNLAVTGTWAKPEGELLAQARRATLDADKFKREWPALAEIDIHLAGTRDWLTLSRLNLEVTGQPVHASGRVPVPKQSWAELRRDPLAFLQRGAEFQLQVPETQLAEFGGMLPDALAPAGTVRIDAQYRGGALRGEIEIQGAATRPIGPLGVLQDINANVALAERTLTLRSVTARSGGQPITLSGTVMLPRGESVPRYDAALRGNNLPFVRRTGLLVRGDIDLTLKSTDGARPTIGGRVQLRDSLFLQDVRALLPQGGGSGPTQRPPYFSVDVAPFSSWRLDVAVAGDEFLRLGMPVFQGVASAHVTLVGTLGEPRAIGQASIDEGEVLMPFANFEVQQGTVRLTQANPHEPQIYVRGTTRKYGYDLTVVVDGTASAPRVEFSSSPPLDAEAVLLMVTAGIVPGDEISYSNTQRATRLGTYLGRGLLGSLGAGSSGADRLSIESGREISRQGRETYNIEYEISDRWAALGEYNEFDEYIAGVRWRVFPRPDDERGEKSSAREERDDVDAEAEIDVDGAGWLKNRELRASLERLVVDGRGVLDANAIEDAAVILRSGLVKEGYHEPEIQIETTLRDGQKKRFVFDPTFAHPLPRDLAATHVEFDLAPGLRWHIAEVDVSGLTAFSPEKAKALFRSEQALLASSRTNAYSPARVTRGERALLGELRQLGYMNATVEADVASEVGGAVALAVTVREGSPWMVESVRYPDDLSGEIELPPAEEWIDRPFTPTLEQDFRETLRRAYFRAGHPDAGINVEVQPLRRNDEVVAAELVGTVVPGEHVTVGTVRFEGNERTKESVLRRRVELEAGDPLNPLALERARFRISKLGVFESVDLHYEPPDGPTRDPVFAVHEAPPLTLDLLAGYGSFEQLRAGFELRHMNLFGHAHQGRLHAVQSMKSTSVDLTYTVPELFGESIDGSAEVYGLRREEIAFLREEYGASFTLRRPVPQLDGDATLRYTLEALRNRRNSLAPTGRNAKQFNVASVSLALTGDRRDNQLRPRRGYNWTAQFEAADPALGGNSTYQRAEFTAAYHTPWGETRWIHAGLSHGFIATIDGDDSTLPVNRRFYPGGDSSIRGYQNGEAAPRDADGRFLGAKAFLLLNVEVEQALTPDWSVVGFVNALGITARLRDYPFQKRLYSAGLGLRYQTIIGPVRLEYGRNLNPRPRDPSGTWHLSIGYPF